METDLFLRFEESAVAALRDQQRDFLRRMNVAVARARQAEHAEHEIAAAVQYRDQRRIGAERPLHRHDGVDERLRGMGERDGLGECSISLRSTPSRELRSSAAIEGRAIQSLRRLTEASCCATTCWRIASRSGRSW